MNDALAKEREQEFRWALACLVTAIEQRFEDHGALGMSRALDVARHVIGEGVPKDHYAEFLTERALAERVRREAMLPLLELGRKWLRESAIRPIRTATYGTKDDLEHCADDLEQAIRALVAI